MTQSLLVSLNQEVLHPVKSIELCSYLDTLHLGFVELNSYNFHNSFFDVEQLHVFEENTCFLLEQSKIKYVVHEVIDEFRSRAYLFVASVKVFVQER